jgi:tRNA dimethylallyltransferase
MNLKKIIIILGPTASGKTELSIKLAERFNGEIISADSRQIYKEMNIGTAKVKKEETKRIPHHLIDIRKPNQEFNVAIYKELAINKIKEIQEKRKLPFLVGGTGLYIKSVVENIKFPKVPPQKELREKLSRKSEKELFNIYKKLDPEGSEEIKKNNKRRLIRAIEVSKVTGKPFWEQRGKGEKIFDSLQIGINLPKKELDQRIEKRVEKMIDLGLKKETKKLVKKYGWIPLLQTIGYQEWKEYFEGEINEEEVKNKIITHTKQFAKRQMTWFKRNNKIKWIQNYKEAKRITKKFLE